MVSIATRSSTTPAKTWESFAWQIKGVKIGCKCGCYVNALHSMYAKADGMKEAVISSSVKSAHEVWLTKYPMRIWLAEDEYRNIILCYIVREIIDETEAKGLEKCLRSSTGLQWQLIYDDDAKL